MTQFSKDEVLLKVSNVSLSFPEKKVLRDINFEVRNITRPGVLQGQVMSLIGRSGMGKTQLFRIMAGLKKPDAGEVLVGAKQKLVTPGDMGVVPQNYYLFEWRKVKSILELAVKKNPFVKESERKDLIKQYVGDFQLEEHLDKYPMQLSGGQRQRVSIIQQLLNGSDFLLLDEPFSGLDAISIRQVSTVLRKVSLSDEVKTLVIVSHDLQSSLALSDTALVLGREAGKEGATIIRNIDMVEKDMCWRENIQHEKSFQELIAEIESIL